MTIEELFKDKTLKAKAKVTQIGNWLLDGTLPMDELLVFTEKQSKTNKANCIESIEFATKKNPNLADEAVWALVTQSLQDEEPRIKWESAKVIANVAQLFPNKLAEAIAPLLANAQDKGTVVRWAAATALGEILKISGAHRDDLLPKIEQFIEKEEDTGVNKKYMEALKKVKKKTA